MLGIPTSDRRQGRATWLGLLLRDRRKSLGHSLQRMSGRTGISVPRLSEYETGVRLPGLRTLPAVSRGYRMPLPMLLTIRSSILFDERLLLLGRTIKKVRRDLLVVVQRDRLSFQRLAKIRKDVEGAEGNIAGAQKQQRAS